MRIKIDCKHAKSYDEKHIKCKRDGSIRNIAKMRCKFFCPHYKKTWCERLKVWRKKH
ncbi:MAG: hypothetical protein ACI4IS_00230 [Acutalibacteraceae bacterium]